jgi:ribose transport system permease protein
MSKHKEKPEHMANERRGAQIRSLLAEYLGMTAALALLLIVFGLTAKNFLTPTTFRTIANQIPDTTIAAVGMTFVLIIAGIDLSVGSVLALAGAVLGIALVHWGLPLGVAVVICLLVGLACGAANGLVIIRWRLPSFIVTLGMLEVARGAAYLVTQSRTIYVGGPIEAVTETTLLGLSLPFLLALAIVAGGQLVLSRTVFGRYLVAIGTNEEAVRLSGIDPRPYKFMVFVLAGLLAAVAAVIQTARMSSANPNTAIGFELQVIAAVVIGGTSLMGGRGSVVSSFFGVLIIQVLGAGLAQVGAQEYTKRLITGCVIVAAVILDQYRHRLRRPALAER